ncbi:MAG TPA: hypothetical protein VI997_06935 [Candidatus Thermoplasmatota archaeon]|nr:hypothetical protein [Candidatus Thermoplasmatota archaeon]
MPRALRARTVPVAEVDAATRDAMWRLYEAHYEGVARAVFERDLAEKRHVVLARDATGALQGFSTLTSYRRAHEGRALIVVFSGDTVVAPAHWGDRALQNAFGRYITRVRLAHPCTPVWWFLVSKGYKTYLLLTRNFPEHWPRHDRETPAWHRGALDAIARERFGGAWDPAAGIVRTHGASARVRAGLAPIEEPLLAAPDVRYFVHANPGHARGDELACLGRVTAGIWVRYAFRKGLRRRSTAARGRAWASS